MYLFNYFQFSSVHSSYTGYLGDAREGEDGMQERYSRGFDLLGGASMALFYIISNLKTDLLGDRE